MMRLLLASGKERGSVWFVPPFAEKYDPLDGDFFSAQTAKAIALQHMHATRFKSYSKDMVCETRRALLGRNALSVTLGEGPA